ncbi:MAG: hypothetical protein M1838_005222 [Thelocarpon superellum]|nr:MAG: hypothetical protein M1838_005222 [Thelocarpon superellum]
MAAPPPPPPTPGYINNPGGSETVRFSTILPALATFAVAGRLILRQVQRVGWATDDYLIVFALVCIWTLCAFNVYIWHYGLGLHITEVPIEDRVKALKLLYAWNLVYILDIGAVKLSILFFYKRVFAIDPRTRTILFILMSVIVAWVVAYFFAMLAQCAPVQYFWTRAAGAEGQCDNTYALYISENIFNVITDVFIYVFPMPIVWALQITRAQKFGLMLIFMAGGLVCAISIVRTTTIKELVDPDFTWADTNAGNWTQLEICIACITACLPTTRALVVRWVSPFRSWTSSKRNKYGTHTSKSDQHAQGQQKAANESRTAFVADVQAEPREKDVESAIPLGSIQVQHGMHWSEDRALG